MLISLPKTISAGLEGSRVKETAANYPWLKALTCLTCSLALLGFLYLKDYTRRLNIQIQHQQQLAQQLYKQQSFLVLTKQLYQQQQPSLRSPFQLDASKMYFPGRAETIVIF